VATISRIDKIIGLFCRIPSLSRALLQKRPIILSILLTKAIPYLCNTPSLDKKKAADEIQLNKNRQTLHVQLKIQVLFQKVKSVVEKDIDDKQAIEAYVNTPSHFAESALDIPSLRNEDYQQDTHNNAQPL